LQLTDELAQQLYPKCSGVQDLSKQMEDAERMEAQYEIVDDMRQTLCQQLTDLVEVDVPEFYFREVASSEYQAELLTSQSKVPSLPEQNLSDQPHFCKLLPPKCPCRQLWTWGFAWLNLVACC